MLDKIQSLETKVENDKTAFGEMKDKLLISFKTFELIMVLNLQALELDGRVSFRELNGYN